MGSQSNGNPYCGLTITVSLNGKTVVARVVDKCMGCTGRSIDLSKAAFDVLASEDVGRTTAEWWFN
jgi:rare lipoprotein A (peptidoglycan hydrolase)